MSDTVAIPSELGAALREAGAALAAGRAATAFEPLMDAIAAAGTDDTSYEPALRQALVLADAARNPKWVIAAGSALRDFLVERYGRGHADLSGLLLQQAEMVMMERDPAGAERLAGEALELRRAARAGAPSKRADVDCLEALLAVCRYQMAAGKLDILAESLSEARAALAAAGLSGEDHDVPMIAILRIEMTVAEKSGRRDAAIAAITEILRLTPDSVQHGQTDLDANKVQMLVRLARHRLALGQPGEAGRDVARAEQILTGLQGKIPQRPADIVRATLLSLGSDAAARQGQMVEAGEKYEIAMLLLDRLSGPEIDELRKKTQANWAGALRLAGREAEALAVMTRPRVVVAPDLGLGHGHDGHRH